MRNENRYHKLFARLKEKNEGAFIPFVMLGDPDAPTSGEIIKTLAESGADALELGIPFSDPVADGPVVQAAASRALAAGTSPDAALEVIAGARRLFPDIPIGLLVYANLVVNRGPEDFYAKAGKAGVDSVLVADVPAAESRQFISAARTNGVDPVFIVPPNAGEADLRQLAGLGGGYSYYLGRAGVTGADKEMTNPEAEKIRLLKEAGAPPIVVGFGISTPEHVCAALNAGADGVISGSAVVRIIGNNLADKAAMFRELAGFTGRMKEAAKKGGAARG